MEKPGVHKNIRCCHKFTLTSFIVFSGGWTMQNCANG